MKRLLLALGALALAAGCSSSSSSSSTSGSTGKTTAGTATTTTGTSTTGTNGSTGTHGSTGTAGTTGTTGSTGTTGTTGGSCTEITPGAFQAGQSNSFFASFTPDVGTPSPDQIQVLVFADDAGAFDLSTAPNNSVQDCLVNGIGHCVLAIDPLLDGGTNKVYFNTAGTMTVTQSDMFNAGLTGSISGVFLRELLLTPDGGALVADGGECLHVTNAAIDVAPFDAGPPPDAGPLPPGGTCTTALPLSTDDGGFFYVTGDTSTSHGDEYNSANCGGSGPDLFYSFTIRAASSVTATLTPTVVDGGGLAPAVDILRSCDFTGDAGSFETACAYTSQPNQPVSAFGPRVAAGSYYVVADGRSGSNGPFSLTVSLGAPVPAPINDTCAGGANGTPIPLVLNQPATGDTFAATNDYFASGFPDDGGGCFPFNTGRANDVVYSFTPTLPGLYKFTMAPIAWTDGGGGNADVAFYIVSACPTGRVDQCVGGADNNVSGQPETLSVNLTAATQYLVIADGYRSGDNGPFSLVVTAGNPDGGPPAFSDGGI